MSGVRVPAPPPSSPRPGPARARLRRLEPIVRRALAGPCALPPGSRLLVALSGGADSTALLLALTRLAPELGLAIHAAHLHHGLRGPEADADQTFARGLCRRLGVPLVTARWDTRRRMRRRGLAGENGLRTLRREFLVAAARRAGAVAIATAHTADDQLETVLMRLLRGTGLAGLGGMRPRRGTWRKPLLAATRAEVEADLRAAGEPWREDRSNADRAHLRNRLRHDAIPALLATLRPGPAAGPAARAGLARRVAAAAAEVQAAAAFLERRVVRDLRRAARIQSGLVTLDLRPLASYPLVARHRLLRRAWAAASPGGEGLTRGHLDALVRLMGPARGGARVALAGGWSAERRRDTIRFQRRGPQTGRGGAVAGPAARP